MSIGLRFIRAVVQQGAVPALLGIRPDYLLEVDEEAEAGAYQFARQHVSAHGVLPDVEMFDEAGFPLGRATTQPVSYYVERLRQRHLYKRINDRFSDLSTAMHARQMDTVLDVLRQMLASTVSHSNNSVSTLASLATDVRNDYLLAKEFPGLRGITTGWGILDAVTLGWQPTDVVVIAGRTGMGKAQPVSEPVLTPEGWVAMGEIRRGDYLVSREGQPTRVREVYPQGIKPVYEIEFRDGTTTRCCDDHLWQVKSAHWKTDRVLTLSEVRRLHEGRRHHGRLSIPLTRPVEMAANRHLVHPYVLGVLLAEGSLTGGECRWTCEDGEVHERMAKLAPLGTRALTYRRDGEGIEWCFRDSETVQVRVGRKSGLRVELERLGLQGCGALEKVIPLEYFRDSIANRWELIRGLMDGDGSVDGTTPSISLSSKVMAYQVRDILHSLGATVTIVERETAHAPSWRLRIRHPEPSLLFHLARKKMQARKTQYSDRLRRTIKLIRRVKDEECQCVTVEAPDGLYLTRDYIVTHNSWVLAKMAYEAWIAGATPLVVTMEMGQLQFARRFVGIHSGINPGFIRAGELSHFGEAQLDAKVQQLVDGASNFHLMAGDFSKKVTAVEAMIEELNPTVAFVDAAYLLSTEGAKKGYITKWESIANVMAELKTVAIRKGIPIVLTVQMNRNKKKDNNTVADTTDLAGSDSISQDASAVITLRRGLAPYENVRRVLDLIKFREGEEISFSTNFRFNPVDFSEVEDSTDEAPVGDGSTTSWMI